MQATKYMCNIYKTCVLGVTVRYFIVPPSVLELAHKKILFLSSASICFQYKYTYSLPVLTFCIITPAWVNTVYLQPLELTGRLRGTSSKI